MVAVPRSSIDQVKVITEHDVLKFIGTLATALLIPLLMWSFISLHSTLGALSDKVVELHEQVAILKMEMRKQYEHTVAEFDATKSQIRQSTSAVTELASGTRELVSKTVLKVKTAKRK